MNKRRILIISHNPINRFDNMGRTIGNIFSKFKPEELCQLYFKEQLVSSDNCTNFFCIDDFSVVKSIFNRFYKTGKITENNFCIDKGNSLSNSIFEYGRKKSGLVYILRDFLWKIGKWNTKELNDWISENEVTSIFLFVGDYIFPINIALKLSKKYKVPVYIYFVDEYYRKNIGKKSILSMIHKMLYRRKIKKIVNFSKEYFCISEEMQNFYEKVFKKNGNVLMNTTDFLNFKKENKSIINNKKMVITYIGGLGYNRWKSIIDIAEVISNNALEDKIEFKIYSKETNQAVVNKLKSTKGLMYMGELDPQDIFEKIVQSDVLLHTESFERLDMEKIKYSVSTKIPDYLASGKLLLVYGSPKLASISYILKNDAGVVIKEKNEILNVLTSLLNNEIDINKRIANAKKLVKINHKNDAIYDKLNKILE